MVPKRNNEGRQIGSLNCQALKDSYKTLMPAWKLKMMDEIRVSARKVASRKIWLTIIIYVFTLAIFSAIFVLFWMLVMKLAKPLKGKDKQILTSILSEKLKASTKLI